MLSKKELLNANFFRANRKNKLSPRLMTTLSILIIAYCFGFSLALNQAKGIITKASNSNVQITRLIYFTSILIKEAIWFWKIKANTKKPN